MVVEASGGGARWWKLMVVEANGGGGSCAVFRGFSRLNQLEVALM